MTVIPRWAYSQDTQGEIEEEEIIIRKGKKLKLPPASRNYKKIKIETPKGIDRNIDLSFRSASVGLSPLDPAVRIKTLKPEPLKKLYGAYVKGGLGNFGTTNLEFYYENKRDKNKGFGVFVDHLASARGPGDNADLSAESHNKVGVFGEYSLFNSFGVAKLGYQRDHVNYFGFDQGSDFVKDTLNLEHNFNRFNAELGLKSFNPGSYWFYDLGVVYRFTGDNFNTSEHLFDINADVNYEIQPGLKGGVKLNGTISSYGADTANYSRNLIGFLPYVMQEKEKYAFEAGIRIVSENDTILQDDIHIYPVGLFTYHLLEKKLDAFIGVDGSPFVHSYHEVSMENPWIGQGVYLGTGNLALNLFGGIKGNLNKDFWYELGLKYKTIDRLPMLVNDVQDTSRFTVLYERGNSTLFQFEGLFTWQIHRSLSLDFEGRLNNYSMARQERPWHLPTTELTVRGNYLAKEKVLFKLGLYYLDGIYALDSRLRETKLDPIFDLSLGIDYFISDRFTVFGDFNNLLGKNYQRYLNYPVKGFNFIAGASYSF